jgi:tellurite resistance protein TerC
MEPGFPFAEWLGKPAWMWLAFIAVVTALLAFDLGVLHRRSRAVGMRESLVTSALYIALGLAFGAGVWWQLGPGPGMSYLTGFAVEKALAMDNVFVIAMVFGFFAVPRRHQHKVLFWGVLGVVVLRAVMIGLGAAILSEFAWVLHVFAAVLVATGVKMILFADRAYDPASNPVLRLVRRHLNVTDGLHGGRFWVRRPDPATGRPVRLATPLFLALVFIELADVMFAVDSVPAIFAITTDPFVVYTSNVFAILGLRALYFALAAVVHRFHYVKFALAAVLVFIGAKILVGDMLGVAELPPVASLAVTLGLLGAGVAWSLVRMRGAASDAASPHPDPPPHAGEGMVPGPLGALPTPPAPARCRPPSPASRRPARRR